jgi:lysophospholipase L1-like esterase
MSQPTLNAANGSSEPVATPATPTVALPLWKRLLYSAVVVVTLVSLPELALRITHLDRRLFRDPYDDGPGLFSLLTYDPVLYWKGRPFAVIPGTDERLNARGFRGPDFRDDKPPGVRRIVCMGDSATFGLVNDRPMHFSYDPTYSLVLENLLNIENPGERVQVINAGVIGYSTLQGLRLLKFYVRYWHPDLITIRYGVNDHLQVEPNYLPAFEPRNAFFRWGEDTLLELHTYQVVARLRTVLRSKTAGAGVANGLRVPQPEFDYNMRRLVEEGRKTGARVVVMTAPVAPATPEIAGNKVMLGAVGFPTYDALVTVHRQYEDTVRRVAAELNVDMLDNSKDLEARGLEHFFSVYDIGHPNGRGHVAIAQDLANLIRSRNLLP